MTTQPHTQWVPKDTFGGRLILLRHALGALTIQEAAEMCGQKTATWSTWERGSRPRKMDEVVQEISDATGVDRDWLMWGKAAGTPNGPNGGGGLPRLDSNQEPPGFRVASGYRALKVAA